MAILDGKLDVTTQEGYDVACILRGPDFAALDNLKTLLTVPVRILMGASTESTPHTTDTTRVIKDARAQWYAFREWLPKVEDRAARTFIEDAIGHWAWHLAVAYEALLTVKPSEELEQLLTIAKALHLGEGVSESLEAYAHYLEGE